MQPKNTWLTIAAPLLLGYALPMPALAADTTVASSPLSISISRAVGSEAVIASGHSASARTLEATLYATFSRELPTVVLSRRTIRVDADGSFATTLSTASAYFRSAIVTVTVRAPDGTTTSAHFLVNAPNVGTSADLDPTN